MNIQALNAGSNLNRPRVPKSVSFGNNIAPEVAQAATETVEENVKKLPKFVSQIAQTFVNVKNSVMGFFSKTAENATPIRNTVKKYASKAGEKASEAYSKVAEFAKTNSKKAWEGIQKYIADNKGSKGIKKIALAITAIATGALAIKEAYDIVTGSNADNV